MAKFHGVIGYFVGTEETSPGVYTDVVTERNFVGDMLRNNQRWEKSEQLNDNLDITNRFSIVADSFALANFQSIRYIKWNEVRWSVRSIDIERPRLILTVGGVYNG